MRLLLTFYSVLFTVKGTEYKFQIQAQNSENYGVASVEFIRTEDGGKHWT